MKQFNPNKIYKCRDCKQPFTKNHPIQPRCIACAIEKGRKDLYKAQKKAFDREQRERREQWREKKSKLRNELGAAKDPNTIQVLQRFINKLVRLIDKGHPCISSDKMYKEFLYDAGHFHNVGSHRWIRFHLLNIWKQSKYDNNELEGNKEGYRANIINLYGQELMQQIDGIEYQYQDIKLMKHEIEAKIKIVKELIKEVSKALETKTRFTLEERLQLRIEFNNRIGIYK